MISLRTEIAKQNQTSEPGGFGTTSEPPGRPHEVSESKQGVGVVNGGGAGAPHPSARRVLTARYRADRPAHEEVTASPHHQT